MKKLGIHDILETKRCIIRVPEETEAQNIWDLVTPNIQKYLVRENFEGIKDSKKETQKGQLWDAYIIDKRAQKPIGRISISYISDDIQSIELGYWISEDYWGQGIIPECIEEIKKFAFEKAKYEKIIIKCDSRNTQSVRVAEKCGFQKEGLLRKDQYVRGRVIDRMYFGLLKEEYLGKKTKLALCIL